MKFAQVEYAVFIEFMNINDIYFFDTPLYDVFTTRRTILSLLCLTMKPTSYTVASSVRMPECEYAVGFTCPAMECDV
jgi:hypothetical protein